MPTGAEWTSDVFSSGDNHGRTTPLIVPTLGSGSETDPDT